jgi:hypothetical protein
MSTLFKQHLNTPIASPQGLANSLYAVAVLGLAPSDAWMDAALDAFAARCNAGGAEPQHVANVLWALARVSFYPGPCACPLMRSHCTRLEHSLGCHTADQPHRLAPSFRPHSFFSVCFLGQTLGTS